MSWQFHVSYIYVCCISHACLSIQTTRQHQWQTHNCMNKKSLVCLSLWNWYCHDNRNAYAYPHSTCDFSWICSYLDSCMCFLFYSFYDVSAWIYQVILKIWKKTISTRKDIEKRRMKIVISAVYCTSLWSVQ